MYVIRKTRIIGQLQGTRGFIVPVLTGFATIVRVTTAKIEPPNTAQTSITTGTFTATAGNCIVVAIRQGNPPVSITSVTDTAGNTYTLATSYTATDPSVYLYYAKNITGNGSNAVTVNFGGGGAIFSWAYAVQYSGVHTSSPIDVTDSKNGTGVTDIVSNSFSTAQAKEVVVLGVSQSNTATYTAGTDFALLDGSIGDNGGSDFGGVQDYITTALLTTYTAHITSTVTNGYSLVLATLKAAPA